MLKGILKDLKKVFKKKRTKIAEKLRKVNKRTNNKN